MTRRDYVLAALALAGVALYLNDKARITGGLMLARMTGAPAVDMQISQDGINQLEAREGFNAYSYMDAQGRSIGFGHFIKFGESFSEPMSRPDAEALLSDDLGWAQDAVRAAVSVSITQSMFDALVSFAYNTGAGAFASSTLVKKLNAGDYVGASAEFARWNKTRDASGNLIASASLAQRRASESSQFMAGGVPV